MRLNSGVSNQIAFAQLVKVDVEKRLVYGRATDESIDRSGEAMDYASSKPLFQKWSEDAQSASGGASLGNIRAMHGKVAAGKATELIFDDVGRTIDVVAKVVDNNEWDKVMEGVYTGFSIGGSYAKTWEDPIAKTIGGRAVKRFTAAPSEISLVDRPCNPNANFFEVRKADGVMEKVAFQNQDGSADNLTKGSTMNRKELEAALLAKDDTTHTTESLLALDDAAVEALHKAEFPDGDNVEKNDGVAGDEDAAAKSDSDELSVKGSDDEVIAFAKFMNENDLSMKDALAAVEKSLIVPDATPMAKGLYTVGSLIEVVNRLSGIVSSVKYEEASEKDGSDIGARLSAAIGNLGGILVDMTAEEVKELLGEDKEKSESPIMALADSAAALVKLSDEKLDEMLKAGARNSAADLGRIQKMHDSAMELGARCAKGNCADDESAEKADAATLEKADGDAMQKLSDENTELKKSLSLFAERLESIEKQVVPSKIVLRAVGKGDDSEALAKSDAEAAHEVKPILKGDGSVDEASTAFKKIHATGGVPLAKYNGVS